MIASRLRFALIALLFISGIAVFIVYSKWQLMLMLWATALLLVMAHFRYGSIMRVQFALQTNRIDHAEQLLNAIKRPQWLTPRYQAYYLFSRGVIAFSRKQYDEGTDWLKRSLDAGLSGKMELAIVHLNLAHVAFYKQNYEESNAFLEKAKQQGVSDLYLKQRFEELERALQKHWKPTNSNA